MEHPVVSHEVKEAGLKRLIVIGGGAAGFFCAVNAARLNPHLTVTILEKSNKLLSKVKVSGGGRCNLAHACFEIVEMAKRYPRGGNFLKKIFQQFFTPDTIEWFKSRGVVLKTEADGRIFPVTNSSQTVIDCLLREASAYDVKIRMQHDVRSISLKGNLVAIKTANEKVLEADYLCIATGGTTKAGVYNWVKTLGHTIVEPVPSLFTFNLPTHPIRELMGVSVENISVKISGTKLQQHGPLVITHWGLSGPCVLRLSAWGAMELAARNWQFKIVINWLPNFNENQMREAIQQLRFQKASQSIYHKNPFNLPKRLWEFILQQSQIEENTRWADLPAKQQNLLIKNLVTYECDVKGKTTFKEEFVTAGGISLTEIDSNTMMSKIVPNLYFAGEVINVDGITGGYNFQNAWSTGFVAAKSIASD